MSGTISEEILCQRDEGCNCELHQALRERDEARAALGRSEDQRGRNLSALMECARQRDAARAVAAKLYAGQPLSPTEHDLARDWLPQRALEGP